MKVFARKILSCFLAIVLSFGPDISYAQSLVLPAPGAMVATSDEFIPVVMKGLTVHPQNPLLFDFIVDTGNSGYKTDGSDARLNQESQKLIKYFLASMTIPDQDQWVNLSPYEKDRIIPEELGRTELGRDMLAQDYILKQITASLIYPEKELGRTFWARVYERAQREFGVTDVPMDVFNKVWVMADKASVYKNGSTVFVANSHLKVMLESDRVAAFNSASSHLSSPSQKIAEQIIREIVLPELEKEVNTGRNFAGLRQIFHSMILAVWYKKNLKEALLTQVYADSKKTAGVEGLWVGSKGADIDPDQIYDQYVAAFKAGVFNYIKDDESSAGDIVARKYFSGGIQAPQVDFAQSSLDVASAKGSLARVRVSMIRNGGKGLGPKSFDQSYESLALRRGWLRDQVGYFGIRVEKLASTRKNEDSRSMAQAKVNLWRMKKELREIEIQMARTLKISKKFSREDQAMAVEGDGVKSLRKERVLVVDDEPSMRFILEVMLQAKGYEVVLAEDGQEALGVVQEGLKKGEKFNLVITDTDMPRMGGVELVKQIGEIAPGLPVIGMSASKDRFLPGTIKMFVSKPFNAAVFIPQVKEILKVDPAMVVNGGIDLNAENMVLTESGDDVAVIFDPALIDQFRQGDFLGVVPVILNVTPIGSLAPFLAR